MPEKRKTKLRSDQWFNNPKNPDMTALYLEKYMNYGCLLYTSPSPRD